jgi:hypothetical protein
MPPHGRVEPCNQNRSPASHGRKQCLNRNGPIGRVDKDLHSYKIIEVSEFKKINDPKERRMINGGS